MLHVVLYEPEIPQNTGNIMRTCMAMDCRLHLIEPMGFTLNDKNLRRAHMDYVKALDYKIYPDWSTFRTGREGEFYYITRYGDKSPSAMDYRTPVTEGRDIYLVFGKESTGIDKAILRANLDRCLRIPMVPGARSLNLSNCVAICVYIVQEQLGFPGLSGTEVIKGKDFLETGLVGRDKQDGR